MQVEQVCLALEAHAELLHDPHRGDVLGKQIDGPTTVENPWRFASGFSDSTTGFLKFGTRYYDPAIARWTQQDPEVGRLGEPLSLNRYLYVGNNPVNLRDPSGLSWWNPIAGIYDFITSVVSYGLSCFEYGIYGALYGGAAGLLVGLPAAGALAGAGLGCALGIAIEYASSNV